MFDLARIDHIALAVRDIEKSAEWYALVLNFQPLFDNVWQSHPLMIGNDQLALALFATDGDKRDDSATIRVRHFAFNADYATFEAAQQHLSRLNIPFEFADHGIAHSIYFADPDGFRLEITTYDGVA